MQEVASQALDTAKLTEILQTPPFRPGDCVTPNSNGGWVPQCDTVSQRAPVKVRHGEALVVCETRYDGRGHRWELRFKGREGMFPASHFVSCS